MDGDDPGCLPEITHTGKLRVEKLEIDVHTLSNGQRVISEDDIKKFFEWLSESPT